MRSKFTAGTLLMVLILMLTLACSGDDSPAAPDTDRTQQELAGHHRPNGRTN